MGIEADLVSGGAKLWGDKFENDKLKCIFVSIKNYFSLEFDGKT